MSAHDARILKLGDRLLDKQAGEEDACDSVLHHTLTLQEFEILFHKNQQFLCMVAEKIIHDDLVAEDLVQDFFIRLWEQKDRLRYQSFEAFAYRAVKNSCLDYLRRQQTVEKKFSALYSLETIANEQEDILAQDARLKKILELLDELPAERRKIFELHVLDGRSYKEIAAELGISVNTVKTQLKRAYLSLRGKALILLILNYLTKFL